MPASVAARGDETSSPVGPDARAARASAEPSVRVIGADREHGHRGDADAESSTTFAIGALLDSRYRILRFVGRGGMGEVYEAHDQLMDRQVALKTILRSVADRSRAARRFKAEVRNAQRVAHPHVCRIHDLHEHHNGDGEAPLPFFTMELIDGERLAQRLLGAPLSLVEARQIALQLLDGLAAAHARGVLHLDFKSDNVMLRRGTAQPEAAIMDFGLSRVHGDTGGLLTSDRRQFAGTLPYMSIEQLECRESLGPATDVYAFGVVLYEMLTRCLPFEGESLGTLLLKQLNERPAPPSRRVPGLSHALDRFVLRCLDREPRERFVDAGAALAALNAIGEWVRPQTAFAGWRVLWPAAALLVAGSILLSKRSKEPTAPPEHNLRQLTTRLAPVPAPSHDSASERVVIPVEATSTVAVPVVSSIGSLAPAPDRRGVVTYTVSEATVTTIAVAPDALPTEIVTDGAATAPHRQAARAASRASLPTLAPDVSGTPSMPLPALVAAPSAPATASPSLTPEPTSARALSAAASWTPTRVPKRLSSLGLGTGPTPLAVSELEATPRADAAEPPAPNAVESSASNADAQNRPR